MKQSKISFCTVCMNRLHHLQKTLTTNIFDNKEYDNLEFIVLDYNSSDGLEEYIKESMTNHLQSGRLVYYKTISPEYFNRSHSRNMVFKLANGDIICNIDADNFTGKNFAFYINEQFNKQTNIFLTTIGYSEKQDVLGRICVRKNDFLKVTGYDERMTHYGFEDYDLINRLTISGLKASYIKDDQTYLQAISHDPTERTSNEFIQKNLDTVLVSYLCPSSTAFLFLLKDGRFKKFILIDTLNFKPLTDAQKSELIYRFSFFQDSWIEGYWNKTDNIITLTTGNEFTETLSFNTERNCLVQYSPMRDLNFYQIFNPNLIQQAAMYYCLITNRSVMTENKRKMKVNVNINGFGKDTVHKNFDTQIVIK